MYGNVSNLPAAGNALPQATAVPTDVLPSMNPNANFPGQAARAGEAFFNDPQGKYKLVMQGAFAAVEVSVADNDGFKSDGGSMVTMTNNVELTVSLEGGLGAACCRSCCAGESAFFSKYKLKPGFGSRGDVLIAPALPGEIVLLHLDGKSQWAIQKGAFLAADASVEIGVKMQNFAQGCCSGEGFFILRAKGVGRLLVNSYGSILRYDIQAGETRRIDNGCLVCWTDTMNYKIGTAGKTLGGSILSGEGFVTVFEGPGSVYVQSRSIRNLASALAPYMPRSGGGGGGGSD